jgi:uncharacterized damage-inducible protein DinB
MKQATNLWPMPCLRRSSNEWKENSSTWPGNGSHLKPNEMKSTDQLAKLLRDVHFGGNWTWVNLKDTLAGVDWQQATTKVHSFNTIATLVYHMNYYLNAVLTVLQGKPLTAKHDASFSHPEITTQAQWQALQQKTWADVEALANLVEQLPESTLPDVFVEEKYGNYFRNINGIIEHTNYHIGQIVLIKKIIAEKAEAGT